MTCIIGYIDREKKKIYMGGDSAESDSSYIRTRKDTKVFIREPFIIGFTTSFRMGQLLMSDERFSIRLQKENESDFDYMVSAFIPAIQKLFEVGGFLKKEKDELEGGNFIVGYKDNLYEIESDFQVAEYSDDYCACGIGYKFALGSIYSNKNGNIIEKIKEALKAAEYFSVGVRSPFKIIEMKY